MVVFLFAFFGNRNFVLFTHANSSGLAAATIPSIGGTPKPTQNVFGLGDKGARQDICILCATYDFFFRFVIN